MPKDTIILIPKEMKDKPNKYHQKPQTCCASRAASGTHDSAINVRPLSLEVLPELRFGTDESKEKPLKLDKNGIPIISTLIGFVRRMSEDTQTIFDAVFFDE